MNTSCIQPYKKLGFTPYHHVVSTMNVIFDFSGVLFGRHINNSAYAQTMQAINPSLSIRLLHDCKKQGHRLFALTNWDKQTYEMIAMDPQAARIFSYFDDVVLAGELNIEKPDPRVFNHLLKKHNLVAHECIMVDDQISNIQSAQNIGFKKAILLNNHDFQMLRRKFEHQGIL